MSTDPDRAAGQSVIGIVGPCSSGKSTLARYLCSIGYAAKEIVQEHSAAPAMWRRITNPDILIYLDVSVEVAARREGLSVPSSWWAEERDVRLVHARANCDLYIDTTDLSTDEVAARVTAYVQSFTGQ
jgi:cytidylate kinase